MYGWKEEDFSQEDQNIEGQNRNTLEANESIQQGVYGAEGG